MAAKYQKQQQRRRWTETGTQFDHAFCERVRDLEQGPSTLEREAAKQLKVLVAAGSTFAEIQLLPGICSTLTAAAAAQGRGEEAVGGHGLRNVLQAVAALPFLPNSRPLHRQLLSSLRQLSSENAATLGACLCKAALHAAESAARPSEQAAAESSSDLECRLQLCTGVAWVLSFPNGRTWLADAAEVLVATLAELVSSVLNLAEEGRHIAPSMMESVQEGICGCYALLQAHGPSLCGLPSGRAAVLAAAQAMLQALKGTVLVREAMASAAVTLLAASSLPGTAPAALAAAWADGLFAATPGQVCRLPPESVLEQGLMQRGSSLVQELRQLSDIGRVCSAKGVLACMKLSVLCAILPPQGSGSQDRCLLTAAALPWVCTSLSESPDAHFKYHAVCALSVVLEQSHKALQAFSLTLAAGQARPDDNDAMTAASSSATEPGLLGDAEPGDEAPAGRGDQAGPAGVVPLVDKEWRCKVLQLLWAGFEEPLAQTAKQVQTAFEAALELFKEQEQCLELAKRHRPGPFASWFEERCGSGSFLRECAVCLLQRQEDGKGKYAPLAAVVRRLGALEVLKLQPALVGKLLWELRLDGVGSSVSSLLRTLMTCLLTELEALHAGQRQEAMDRWRGESLGPLLDCLFADNDFLRSSLGSYALPTLLELDPAFLSPLIGAVLARIPPEQPGLLAAACSEAERGVAALVTVLKVARQRSLIGDLDELQASNGSLRVPIALLEGAVVHRSEGVCADLMEMLTCHPRATLLPGSIELRLVRTTLMLCLRCGSSSMRHKRKVLLGKLLARMKVAVHAALFSTGGNRHTMSRKRSAAPMQYSTRQEAGGDAGLASARRQGVLRQQHFMQWTITHLLCGVYPGASHGRKSMAMELLVLCLEEWADVDWLAQTLQRQGRPSQFLRGSTEGNDGSLKPRRNPKHALRQAESAASSTACMPCDFNPFPALLWTPATAQALVAAVVDSWEKVREGAVRVLELLPLPLPGVHTAAAVQQLVESAVGLLRSPRMRENDAGARLLTYVFASYVARLGWTVRLRFAGGAAAGSTPKVEVIAAGSEAATPEAAGKDAQLAAIQALLSSMVDWLHTQLEAGRADLLQACEYGLAHGPLLALTSFTSSLHWPSLCGTQKQAEWTRAWLQRLLQLVREISLLCVPTLANPQETNTDATDIACAGGGGDSAESMGVQLVSMDAEGDEDGIAPSAQVVITGCWQTLKECSTLLGNLAANLPLASVPRSSAGADAEAPDGLLTGPDVEALVELFMHLLFTIKHRGAIEKTQPCFMQLCQRLLSCSAEVLSRQPRECLDRIMHHIQRPGQSLDDVVRRSAGLPYATTAIFLAEPTGCPKVLLPAGLDRLLQIAGDESRCGAERWPRIHALNILRLAFNDRHLALDSSGHFADGIRTCVLALAAPDWDVRNGASLAFTALITRTLGLKNLPQAESAKRAITAEEFFTRFPTLHAFLLQQLQAAVQLLEGAEQRLHPSLYPILVLLSRLRPSLRAQAVPQELRTTSPAAFTPLVASCGGVKHMQIRQMSATALAPLVAQEQMADCLLSLMHRGIPTQPPVLDHNRVHGTLLQLQRLLEVSAALMPRHCIAQLLQATASAWMRLSWLAQAPTSPALRCAFCRVLEALLRLQQRSAQRPSGANAALAVVATGLMPQGSGEEQPEGRSDAAAAGRPGSQLRAWLRGCCYEAGRSAVQNGTAPAAVGSGPQPAWSGVADAGSFLRAWLMKHATRLAFQACLQLAGADADADAPSDGSRGWGEAIDLAELVLHSPHYEARAAGLKQLHLALSALPCPPPADRKLGPIPPPPLPQHPQELEPQLPAAAARRLQCMLFRLLEREAHHKCQGRLLQLLACLSSRCPSPPTGMPTPALADVLHAQPLLTQLLHLRSHPKVRRYALEFWGSMLRSTVEEHVMQEGSNASAVQSCVHFLQAALAGSSPLEAVDMRLAAVKALDACQLLNVPPPQASAAPAEQDDRARLCFRAWSCMRLLLDDEDADVRFAASDVSARSLVAQGAAGASTSCAAEARSDWVRDRAWPARAMVSAHADAVQEAAFDWMARSGLLRHGDSLAEHVRQLLLDPDDLADSLQLASICVGNNVRLSCTRLYDREVDNTYSEPLLLAQLCASRLRTLSAAGALPPAALGLAHRSLEQASAVLARAKSLAGAGPASEWCGGVTNHPDVFLLLARLLLTALALAPPPPSPRAASLPQDQALSCSRSAPQPAPSRAPAPLQHTAAHVKALLDGVWLDLPPQPQLQLLSLAVAREWGLEPPQSSASAFHAQITEPFFLL